MTWLIMKNLSLLHFNLIHIEWNLNSVKLKIFVAKRALWAAEKIDPYTVEAPDQTMILAVSFHFDFEMSLLYLLFRFTRSTAGVS